MIVMMIIVKRRITMAINYVYETSGLPLCVTCLITTMFRLQSVKYEGKGWLSEAQLLG